MPASRAQAARDPRESKCQAWFPVLVLLAGHSPPRGPEFLRGLTAAVRRAIPLRRVTFALACPGRSSVLERLRPKSSHASGVAFAVPAPPANRGAGLCWRLNTILQ